MNTLQSSETPAGQNSAGNSISNPSGSSPATHHLNLMLDAQGYPRIGGWLYAVLLFLACSILNALGIIHSVIQHIPLLQRLGIQSYISTGLESIAIVPFATFLLILFLRRKKMFTKLFKYYAIFVILVNASLFFITKDIFITINPDKSFNTYMLSPLCFSSTWIPLALLLVITTYILFSPRVKATFIHN